ncbi:MAG TPA: hypothetical protein DDW50_21620, partial [Firmicutes bacterium]|nr:hypothetical protein [Bacillota bacterium]
NNNLRIHLASCIFLCFQIIFLIKIEIFIRILRVNDPALNIPLNQHKFTFKNTIFMNVSQTKLSLN